MRTLLILILAGYSVVRTVADAQPLEWERVGTRAYDVTRPSVSPDGTMWVSGQFGTLRLGPPYGPTTPWTILNYDFGYQQVLALGVDTLVTGDNLRPYRSVDNGLTFTASGASRWAYPRTIVEVPLSLPDGGAVVAGADNLFALFSTDRGATWAPTTIPNRDQESPYASSLAVVRTGPHAGRLVGAGHWGLATSDDGGASFTPVPGRWQYFRYAAQAVAVLEGAAPGGGDRLAATMVDVEHDPYAECLVVVSDDGGNTWRETADLTGDPNAYGPAVVDFGGGRAVIVMNGGHVWESTDGGETWARLDTVVPGAVMDPAGSPTNGLVFWAMRGPDGRLYVGGTRLGGANPGWAFRTVSPFVAVEASPEPSGVGVSVRPNPAGGRVEVVVSMAEGGTVRVVMLDALGREVAVVLNGEAAAGERVVGVDVSGWPAGVYVVRAAAGERVASTRLVVAR